MKISIIKNHIALQGWMVEELGLRGNKLIIFAIIWGFTGNQKSNLRYEEWTIGYRYIQSWTGLVEEMVDVILKELDKEGLICLNYDNNTVCVDKRFEC